MRCVVVISQKGLVTEKAIGRSVALFDFRAHERAVYPFPTIPSLLPSLSLPFFPLSPATREGKWLEPLATLSPKIVALDKSLTRELRKGKCHSKELFGSLGAS